MTLVDVPGLLDEVIPERGQILVGPITAGVEDFVGDRVAEFFGSDRFDELWRNLNEASPQGRSRRGRGEAANRSRWRTAR